MDSPDPDVAHLDSIFEEIRRIAPDSPEDDVGLGFPSGMSVGEVLRRLRAIPDGAGAGAIEESLRSGPRP